jgi:acetylornithine/N-succinyldiaminopimelate aminotransferase
MEFNNETELIQITDKTACVVIEPVQGEAGIQPADLSFIQTLRRRCDQTGALLVLDEIQTGIGRTGKMFCFEHYQIIPDILLLAKAFGGGMPLGVFIAPKKIMQSLAENPALGHITTFGGHPVCCAAAHAALSVLIDKNLIGTVVAKERMFRELLGKHPSVKEFRSKGLMMALDLGDAEVVKNTISVCLQKGLILDWFLFNDTSIRLAPPLIISESEIEKACHIITECL